MHIFSKIYLNFRTNDLNVTTHFECFFIFTPKPKTALNLNTFQGKLYTSLVITYLKTNYRRPASLQVQF